MRVRDAQDVLANVWFDFVEILQGEFQIFLLSSNILPPIAREQISFDGRLVSSITTIVSDHSSARLEGGVSQAKKVRRFRVVKVMYEAESKDDIEFAELPHRVMTDAVADKLAAVTVSLPRSGDIRLVGIESCVAALGKKGQHVAGSAADVQDTVVGFGADIVLYEYIAAVISPNQLVIGLIKERSI